MAHHSLFRFITAFDGTLIRLNLLFIGMIAFLPYPTALLSASSNQESAVILYAVCASGAGLLEASSWTWARRAPRSRPAGRRRGGGAGRSARPAAPAGLGRRRARPGGTADGSG
jgi:uncharacterized membrane protein